MNLNKSNIDLLKLTANFKGNLQLNGLIKKLIEKGVIKSDRVCKVMLEVDRGEFTDSAYAYEDCPQDIHYGATISAPHMHGMALEYLQEYLQPGNRVLDVGSGSGYLTVVFSKMMEDKGIVVGVEHISELYKKGIENISKSHKNLIDEKKIELKESDGRNGYSEYAPYDAIHVGAASEKVPKALLDQLKPGGRLMIPVGKFNQYIYLIDKDQQGNFKQEPVCNVRYVPLTDKEKQLARSEINIYSL